jgi:hypothetical protein
MLALFVSHGALAANYALNNDNIALSFDDANSTVVVKDKRLTIRSRRRSCSF